MLPDKSAQEEDVGQQAMNKFSLRYESVESPDPARTRTSSRPLDRSLSVKEHNLRVTGNPSIPGPPPLINPQLLTTNPVPASAFLMAAAAAGKSGCLYQHSEWPPLPRVSQGAASAFLIAAAAAGASGRKVAVCYHTSSRVY